jgi:hypothetical protein
MKTMQKILDVSRERHSKKLAGPDGHSQNTRENLTENNGTYFEEGSVLSSVIMTLFAYIIFRCIFNKKKKKTVYIIKSTLWRDEDGQRVAISISMPESPANQTVPLCDASKSRETCANFGNMNHIAGGDLWMLLMSEDIPPIEKKTRRKKQNKIRHTKTPPL